MEEQRRQNLPFCLCCTPVCRDWDGRFCADSDRYWLRRSSEKMGFWPFLTDCGAATIRRDAALCFW
jgi:hypothetical protein